MSSGTTTRRKVAPRSQELSGSNSPKSPRPTNTIIATVKRNKFGTSPFDEHWLNLDCCGLVCAGITYCLHFYGVYAVCLVLLPPWMNVIDPATGIRSMSPWGHLHRLSFSFVAAMACYAHFKAMTTDPGAVPPDAMPLEEQQIIDEEAAGASEEPLKRKKGRRLCRRCNAFKPQRAHHCSVCQRCIIKMDHHCPWVNNCVGIGNHKYFLLFVMYTCISCVYSMTLVVTRFYGCMNRSGFVRGHHMTCLDRPTQLLTILGLVVESLLFGLFTTCMMVDQAGVVTSGMTHIDRLKGDETSSSSNPVTGVLEVFGLGTTDANGGSFQADWLSPFAEACFPATVRQELLGFCRPCMRNERNDSSDEIRASPSNMVRSITEIV